MATELLAVGSTAANSADLVVTTPVTVALKDASGPRVSDAAVAIQLKSDTAQYFTVAELRGVGERSATLIVAPGTYRFVRAVGVSCGVFSA